MGKKSQIYIIRHTQSSQNKDPNRPIGGQLQVELTEEGREQARSLGKSLKGVSFVVAISSDLVRAEESAKIILEQHPEVPLLTTSLLRERHYGELEEIGTEYMFSQTALSMRAIISNINLENRKVFTPIRGMESDQEVVDRLMDVLHQAIKDYKGKSVLIVSHGNVIRTLLVHLGYGNYQELRSGTLENGSYIKLITDGVKFEVIETQGMNKTKINLNEDALTKYLKFYIHIV